MKFTPKEIKFIKESVGGWRESTVDCLKEYGIMGARRSKLEEELATIDSILKKLKKKRGSK